MICAEISSYFRLQYERSVRKLFKGQHNRSATISPLTDTFFNRFATIELCVRSRVVHFVHVGHPNDKFDASMDTFEILYFTFVGMRTISIWCV